MTCLRTERAAFEAAVKRLSLREWTELIDLQCQIVEGIRLIDPREPFTAADALEVLAKLGIFLVTGKRMPDE